MLKMLTAMFACCQETQGVDQQPGAAIEPVPHVVTADIQAGIEEHIEEQTRLGDGYFVLPFEDKELRLKLVRVHTEYLANLGPRRHFACVDLASTEGDVYDVDFFLAGDPGSMTVTETTVHKINGQPFYVWKQNPDQTWERAAVDDASRALLGVIEGSDRFEFVYRATVPQLDDDARMWIPLPASDGFQSVEIREITAPGGPATGPQRILTDKRFGNKVLFLELGPQDSGKTIAISAEIERREKAVYRDEGSAPPPQEFLSPERFVPVNDEFRAIAADVLDGKTGDLVRVRALYDHTIDRMRYMKYGEGYGQGDALYACSAGTGNCTEFHSYFIALARAADIPARFAIGAAIPSERNEGGIDGYHCWAEFYAEDKWWPIDISEADKYSSLATYYFGHHPANRVELSRGRDLVVEPGPVSGPVNFLAYPVLEVAGKPIPVKPQFGFKRLQTSGEEK
ncbi:MAG: transglutaminase domain-containing protein, partial [Phycisphaerales bacterium]|nr:transglutaminase domain-containing protein [Phycisphaerales bacterium]